jgi:hypothetical protein
MSSTTYGIYTNAESVDTEVLTEAIDDDLRGDEKGARIAALFERAFNTNSLPDGSTWVVQASALQRT